jgi:cobalamin biosynthesis Mg chelatase CobN
MKTDYVLIDFENVQPKDLSLLAGHPFKVIVFVGANQGRISFDLAKALQAMGENAEYIQISGTGRNALDFHIAFHLGELASKDREGYFHVISKDTGFDPLVRHLKERGIKVRRSRDLAEMPIPGIVSPKTADERIDAIVKNLKSRSHSRPRRRKTLASSINSLFMNKLETSDLDALIAALEERGAVTIETSGKVGYSL